MRVKLLVSMAGPDECWKPGDTREVSESVAIEWEVAGIAVVLPEEDIIVFSGEPAAHVSKHTTKKSPKAKKGK